MPYSATHKQNTRTRVVQAARKLFNLRGFADVSIAEVMAEAGLTHGGFYKHFGSRDDLIAEAAEHAFAYADQTLSQYEQDPDDPLAAWVDWYVSEEHRDDPGSGCPVAALVGDMGRADDRVRAGYGSVVERYIKTLERMLGGGEDSRRQALIAASTLVGSLALSRAVDDEAVSREVLSSTREALRHQQAPTQ
jgi:TetR/AcrR family transcriptional repressor of nem operon